MPFRIITKSLRLSLRERDELERQLLSVREELLRLGMPLAEVDSLVPLNADGRLDWGEGQAVAGG